MSGFIKPKMARILNSLSVDMVLIKKGSFMMDSKDPDEGLLISYDMNISTNSDGTRVMRNVANMDKIIIENDFELGKYPVTIAEYMHFANDVKKHYPKWMEEGSEYNKDTGTNDHYKKMNLTDNAPVIGISWHDANAYCEWLSKKRGEAYRLPTEAEWEYSCRAGATTKWSFGDDEKELKKYAWYDENSKGITHIVGKKLPNKWKLYDIHGNVWEWCEDWYDKDKNTKVLRGGSWYFNADWTRSSSRDGNDPDNRIDDVGFRLLRTLPS